MAELFRKSSLEKLSSPEQLDKMIVITPMSFWIALVGAAVIIVSALVWSIFGRLPVNVETQGIYINDGGIYTVYAETNGIVESVIVENDAMVKKGDIIAYLNSDEIQKKIDEYARRIELVNAITMNSSDDVVTSDNSNLIDIKNQILTVDEPLQQSMALLTLKTSNIAEQRETVAIAEKKFRDAEANYFNSLGVDNGTSEQLAYSEKQSSLANATGYLEAAYGSLDQAEVAYAHANEQYVIAKLTYDNLVTAENTMKDAFDTLALGLVNNYPSYSITETDLESLLGSATEYLGNDSDMSFKADVDSYRTAYSEYESFVTANAAEKEELKAYVEKCRLEKNLAESTKNNYKSDVAKYQEQKDKASGEYNTAKDNYINSIKRTATAEINNTKLSNLYSVALSEYNNEKAILDNLIASVEEIRIQVESERSLQDKKTQIIYEQFEATKASVVDQLIREQQEYMLEKEKCTITSTVDGKILSMSIVPGSAVGQGSEILRVAQGNMDDKVIVCYVPLSSGKKISEGMEVLVYPTTVNKQEYGHMKATVESVESYVTSVNTLKTQLGNDNLVEAFIQNGPVVAVICKLVEDENTVSGYYWSSSKGAEISLPDGTLVDSSVVIDKKAPITMLIPYIKEKLTIQANK